MTEREIQIAKMEQFASDNELVIHPNRVKQGGIPHMADIFLLNHHCPCKPDRHECPCAEALSEVQLVGYCEGRLYASMSFIKQVKQ